ncbi:MAG: transketolase [Leptospirillia bacterium]
MPYSPEPLSPELELQAINTLRMLSVDIVQKANSGHPGTPMGFAAPAFVLWRDYLRINPKNPDWAARDRFVLSAGHASALLYSLLHLTGFGLTLDDLKSFRQWGSLTPGHPEYHHTIGVETTTGPLGQGFANAVGMALAIRHLGATFNRPGMTILSPRVFVTCGDGDMMEGISNEAASFAGHQGLSNLVCLYDRNHISIDGSTDLAFTEDVPARFRALGWAVREVADGNNTAALRDAMDWATDPDKALPQERDKPRMIAIRTHIGYGSPTYQDTAHVHGTPLGVDEVKKTREHLGWPLSPDFFIPEEVRPVFSGIAGKGAALEEEWNALFARYRAAFPKEAELFESTVIKGKHASGLASRLAPFSPADKPMATRQAFGTVLQEASRMQPLLFGGSADLAPSNNTLIKGETDNQLSTPGGRNIHFGVREHAMGGIMNGMALTRIRPYGGTFLVFSDYMKGAMRLSALMGLPVLYVLTHDSIGLGEDGPTHQPIEHLTSLRALPNMAVMRPADANETLAAMDWITEQDTMPVSFILSRQGLPILDVPFERIKTGVRRGGYILREASSPPKITLMGTGSEVSLLWKVQDELEKKSIPTRLVSLPCTTLFDRQDAAYRDSVMGSTPLRLYAEAGSPISAWRYIGSRGIAVGLDHFGASAPYERLMEEFGFSVPKILARIRESWPEIAL